MILFDANLLVHAHAARSPLYEAANRLRDQVVHGALEACVSPQVLCEFFAVCTDERRFQPALSPRQAAKEIERYWSDDEFQKILPTTGTLPRLVELVTRHPLSQQRIVDALLVATMLENSVKTIYTQNVKDFESYPELRVVDPFASIPRR
jgi:predicted nucleic acid-binding protein